MKYIILTSTNAGKKPCLISIEDIVSVESNYDGTETRVGFRNGNGVQVINSTEDVIARVIEAAAKEGRDAK